MKHTAVQGAKFKLFVRAIRPKLADSPVGVETVAVGILERLWHAAMTSAPRGDIGRFADDVIAELIAWHGDAEWLVQTLVDTGWLDRCSVHRLIIHDWREHAPNHVKGNIQSLGGWASEDSPKGPPQGAALGTTPGDDPQRGSAPNLTKPNQTQPNETKQSARRKRRSPSPEYTEDFLAWWAEYPRRDGKAKACEAWHDAVHRLTDGGKTREEACGYLLRRAQAYAKSSVAEDLEFTPMPATWLNGDRFYDDDSAWQRKTSSGTSGPSRGADLKLSELL